MNDQKTVNKPELIILRPTVLKHEPKQSSQLRAEQLYQLKEQDKYQLHSYAYKIDDEELNGNLKVALMINLNGRNTYYVYAQDVQIKFDDNVVWPHPAPIKPKGKIVLLPNGSKVALADSVCPGGCFTWADVTHNGHRLPPDPAILGNMVRHARAMQKVADFFKGKEIIVSSWFRPPAINHAVGGSSQSRHLYADATDIVVVGMTGRQVYQALDPWWIGGLGMYRGIPEICHIDSRGDKARWCY